MSTTTKTTLTFADAQVSTTTKRTFATTMFHDGDVWQVLPYNAAQNAAVANSAGAAPVPVLRVQRVNNGVQVGNIERVFIASLYRADESMLGVELPKTGALNLLVREIWDNEAYTSDEQCFQALFTRMQQMHADLRFTVSRQPVRNGQGDAVHQTIRYGKQVPLMQMNWN